MASTASSTSIALHLAAANGFHEFLAGFRNDCEAIAVQPIYQGGGLTNILDPRDLLARAKPMCIRHLSPVNIC